jgi:purine-nucleoside phosphorylase
VTATIHIHPTAPLAERVLLPGDPGRALRLAQELLTEPKMFNHNRGLWGYTGPAADGKPLTIQSTGMGGPSAAIVISELVQLGARRLLRVGTCGALDPALALGDLLIVTKAICDDGTSRALVDGGAGAAIDADARRAPSPTLLADLRKQAAAGVADASDGTVVSTDLFYDSGDREAGWIAAGAQAVEMETATLFALAARHRLEAGAVLLVTDALVPARTRLQTDPLHEGEVRLGRLAAAALS